MHLARSVRLKNGVAVVKRPIDGVPLGKADADVGTGVPCRLRKPLKLRFPRNDRGIVVTLPVLPTLLASPPYAEAEIHPNGIPGDKELGKNDEVRMMRRGLVDAAKGLLERGAVVEHHGLRLHHCDSADALYVFHAKRLTPTLK